MMNDDHRRNPLQAFLYEIRHGRKFKQLLLVRSGELSWCCQEQNHFLASPSFTTTLPARRSQPRRLIRVIPAGSMQIAPLLS